MVNGAGGAVGGYAVQLAGRAGAMVTATASERSAGRLRSYGADRIIGHATAPLPRVLAGQQFDVVLDLVRSTQEEAKRLAALAADGGAFVSTTFPDLDDAGRGVRTVKVAGRRPLADLPAVHDEAVAARLAGKTVLIP